MPVPALVTVFTLVGIFYAPGADEAPTIKNYYFLSQGDCETARKNFAETHDDFYVHIAPSPIDDADSKDDSDNKSDKTANASEPDEVPIVDIVSPKCFKALVPSKELEKIE